MTDQSQPATKIDKFTRDILDFCQSDYFLFLEMIQEGDNFLTKTPKNITRLQRKKKWLN